MNTSRRIAVRAGTAALIAVALAGCSSITGSSGAATPASAVSTPAPVSASPAAADAGSSTTPTAPSASPSLSVAPVGAATGAAPADPNRPAGQCSDEDLKVTVQKYGLAASHTIWQFLFTDTGTSACQLRGYPGISVVGHGDGTQLGVPATRDRHGEVVTVTLQPGESEVNALVSVTDIDSDGGPLGSRCPTTAADGWRIYPPHSTRAVFIPAQGMRACTGDTAWMSVDPVTDDPK